MRKRKCGYVSYHSDFTVSRGPTINSVRPYNDSGATGVHIVTVDSPWQIGCPLEIPQAPLSADGHLAAQLVLSDGSRLCPATRTGSGGYLPRAPMFPIEPLTVLALAALVTYHLRPEPRYFEKQHSESIAISSGYTFGKYFWLSPHGESTFFEFSPVQRKVAVRSGTLTPEQWQRLMKEWDPSQLQETDLTQTGDKRIAYEEGPTIFSIRVGESDFAQAVHPYHVHDGKLSG